ncbi:hypothetical protein KUCAC02_026552 [Chaenocephalus aceratus]|nr:hypothetical protein KUCAC02_026552 [Chaenocephalus aceratus]
MPTLFFLSWLVGICVSLDVRQSPSLIKRPGDKVRISCSYDKTDYTLMLWYQRPPGDAALKLIGQLHSSPPFPLQTSLTQGRRLQTSITVSVSLGLDVRQSPSELIKSPGDKVQISCSHDGTDYRVMLWYQRSPGDTALKLIGYLYFKEATMEEPFKDDFVTSGDLSGSAAKNASLIVNAVKPEHAQRRLSHRPSPLQPFILYEALQPPSDIMDVIIFKHSVLTVSIFLLWTAGLTDGSDVTQTDMLWETQGESATMSCTHTKDATYFQMYWYRQLPGETMKLIVYTISGNKGNHDFGGFSKDKFSATKPDAESGTFTVKDLQPGDKGLYFCAVSEHSATHSGGG